tara:strand:- start:545 stop:976 length:432 start_codon:yes stop_codon:yes gene_type:complete
MSKILFSTKTFKNVITNKKSNNNEEYKNMYLKKTLKNKLLLKLYNNKHLNYNSKSFKSSKLSNLIYDMNEQLNVQYDHVFNKFIFHNKKLIDIISIHFKIKYLEEYFAKSSNKYSNMDKIDFYNFLLVFNELIDEINDFNEDI